jgi:uncharacterized protein
VSRFDLTRADHEPLQFDERLTLPAGTGGEEMVSAGGVRFSGTVEKVSRGYMLTGSLEAGGELRCVRCLSTFPVAVAESVEMLLQPLEMAPREEELQLSRDELDVRFFEAPQLDLAEIAGEQLELAIPMKPLCDDACKGLCPRCGANLNQGSCDCPPESDERWRPLAYWRPSEE